MQGLNLESEVYKKIIKRLQPRYNSDVGFVRFGNSSQNPKPVILSVFVSGQPFINASNYLTQYTQHVNLHP